MGLLGFSGKQWGEKKGGRGPHSRPPPAISAAVLRDHPVPTFVLTQTRDIGAIITVTVIIPI